MCNTLYKPLRCTHSVHVLQCSPIDWIGVIVADRSDRLIGVIDGIKLYVDEMEAFHENKEFPYLNAGLVKTLTVTEAQFPYLKCVAEDRSVLEGIVPKLKSVFRV